MQYFVNRLSADQIEIFPGFFWRKVIRYQPDVVVGPKDEVERFGRAEDIGDVRIKRDHSAVDCAFPFLHNVVWQGQYLGFAVKENDKMKLRLAKTIVDTRTLEFEPRHTVARLDGKITAFTAQRVVLVIYLNLRDARKDEPLDDVEAKEELR